jgi:EpsI family protein
MQQSDSAPRNLVLTAALLALAALTYWPSSQALWDFWSNDNTAGAHGFLVAPLAAWLLYRARHRLAAVAVRPSRAACVMLVVLSIAWLVFWRSGIQELHILSLPMLMGLSVWAALGWRAACIAAFPIGYLYFAVPAWGIFIDPLEHLTSRVVGALAPYIGVPAHRQGDLIIFPGGIIEVAHGCSGQAFLTVGLAVAALLGELENASPARRALLAAVLGAAAIIANWIRVLVIVDAGYTTHMRHVLVSRSHFAFGWFLFTGVIVACVWFLARRPGPPPPVGSASRASGSAALRPAYLSAGLALIALPVLVYSLVLRMDGAAAPIEFRAPLGQNSWRGPVNAPGVPWKPEYVGAHSQWYFAYQGPSGQNVEMVAIGYPMQSQGRELVNEENLLFGRDAPDPTAQAKVTLGEDTYIETVGDDAQGHHYLVWSVYDIGGRPFVTPLASQLWYGLRSLTGPPYSMQFAFRTPCEGDCNAARATLKSFLQTMGRECFASVGRFPIYPTSRPI